MSKLDIGRNDPCPCGSGKKYKRCCLLTQVPPASPVATPRPADSPPRRGGSARDAIRDAAPPELGDVTSPAYWEKLSKRLPRERRQEWAPLIAQAKAHVEFEARQEEVDAACEVLAAHRPEYVKFSKDPQRLFSRATDLFAEEPFAAMRFQAADVQRAFEAVGYPPPGATGERLYEALGKAICFLVDDAQGEELARRILFTLPDYVAAGRYMDGWIIQHSAMLTAEKTERVVGPFLLAMFMHGMTEWEDLRQQDEEGLLKKIGIDPHQIREKGFEGLDAVLREALSQPGKAAALQKYLAKHPELHAMTQALCRAHEDAAIALLLRPDAHILLLSRDEVAPWLAPLEQRIRAVPKLLAALSPSHPPDEAALDAFKDLAYSFAREMAREIFTPARLERLTAQVHAYRRQLPGGDAEAAHAGVNGALLFAKPGNAAEENYFLVTLCWASLHAAMKSMGVLAQGAEP